MNCSLPSKLELFPNDPSIPVRLKNNEDNYLSYVETKNLSYNGKTP